MNKALKFQNRTWVIAYQEQCGLDRQTPQINFAEIHLLSLSLFVNHYH